MTVLKNLLEETKDGEWGKGDPDSNTVAMKVVRGTDFEDFRQGILNHLPLRYIARRHAERKTLRTGDIIIETAGGSKDRPTGRTAFVNRNRISASDLPMIPASFARFLRPNAALVEPAYLYWKLQGMYADGSLYKYHTQHTGVARFQFTTFATQEPIDLPSRAVQIRTASILSAYDDLIENNTRRITILEEMARRIYQEWFVDFRAPGCKSLLLAESPLGELANEVRVGCLPSELDPSVPYVGLEHIPRRSTTMAEWGTVDSVTSLKLRFVKGDILFGKIRPYFHKVAVAANDGVASSDAIVIRPIDAMFRSIVLAVTSSDSFIEHAVQTSNGTKMPRADWKVLSQYPVPIPDRDTLARFDQVIWPTVELAMNLAKQNRTLRAQRDVLLTKLISGEIDLSEAQELLEAAE